MTDPSPVWDAIVVGAGIAGAAAALGLKRAFGDGSRVMLCDPALPAVPVGGSLRAVALAPDMRRFLDGLGVWADLVGHAQPIAAMVITDARPGLLPNPTFLSFGDTETRGEPLAHIVLADALRSALLRACTTAGVTFETGHGQNLAMRPWSAVLTLQDGRTHRARLLVGADGGRSRLRAAARIQAIERPYNQAAVISTLHHREDHRGQATQHFFPAGPIALLPMRSDDGARTRSSLVWTEGRDEAVRLAALPPSLFCAALEARAGLALGPLQLEDEPRVYPLTLLLARRLTSTRLALVGDAARVIHPLAGQGLNLGLRDAAALVRQAGGAAALGLDVGSERVLAGYTRERSLESTLMAAGTDALDRLFSNDGPLIRAVRDLGLSAVCRSPLLKRNLAQQAAGAPFGRARRRPAL